MSSELEILNVACWPFIRDREVMGLGERKRRTERSNMQEEFFVCLDTLPE